MLLVITKDEFSKIQKDKYKTGVDGISSVLVQSAPYKVNIIGFDKKNLLCTFHGSLVDLNIIYEEVTFNQVQHFKDSSTGKQIVEEKVKYAELEQYQKNRLQE
ncbi:hypothetical protein EB155_12065, partial [archaeon]|nr:hypothetical protein [archaeon]